MEPSEGRKGAIKLTDGALIVSTKEHILDPPPPRNVVTGWLRRAAAVINAWHSSRATVPFMAFFSTGEWNKGLRLNVSLISPSLGAIALSSVSHSLRRRSWRRRSSGRRTRKDMGDYPCKDGTVKLPFIPWRQWAIPGIYFILKAPCSATTSANNILRDVSHPWHHLVCLSPSGRSCRALRAHTCRLRDSFCRTEQNQILHHPCVVNCAENLFSTTLTQMCNNGTTFCNTIFMLLLNALHIYFYSILF